MDPPKHVPAGPGKSPRRSSATSCSIDPTSVSVKALASITLTCRRQPDFADTRGHQDLFGWVLSHEGWPITISSAGSST